MKAVLTDKLLRALVAKGEPHEPIWDQNVKGFGVRTGKHGTVSFFAMRNLPGSRRPIRLTLGGYPTMPLAEARERARARLRDLSDGIDPREREAERQRAAMVKRSNTYSSVAEEFIRRQVAGKRTAGAIELRIRRELIKRWGDWPIVEVTRPHVVEMVNEIVDRGHPEAARQTFTYGRRLHNWAIAFGNCGLEHSPYDRIGLRDLIGAKKPRQRVLTEQERALIWRATEETAPKLIYGPYIRLLLLLGVRRTELARATWDEFDLDKALWIIPATRMKSDEAHSVPLPQIAVDILRALPRFSSGYVFSALGSKPLNDFGAIKCRLDARIAELNDGKSFEHDWTLHDCRRSFRTALSALAIAPLVCELAIGHRQSGLMRVYDLHRYDVEKRHAFNAHAAWLLRIVEPLNRDVVPLRKTS